LRDECVLLKQCDNIMKFFAKHNENEKVAQVGLVKLDHIYYKNDSLYEMTKKTLKDKPKELGELYFLTEPSQKVVNELVENVVKNCKTKYKIKAVL